MESFRERAGSCHNLVCTICGQLVAKSNTVKFAASSYVDRQGEVLPMDVFHKERICTKCHRYARKHRAVPQVDVVSNIVEDSHQEEEEGEDVRSDGSIGFRSRQTSVGSEHGVVGGERSHHPHNRSREGSADSLEDLVDVVVAVAGPSRAGCSNRRRSSRHADNSSSVSSDGGFMVDSVTIPVSSSGAGFGEQGGDNNNDDTPDDDSGQELQESARFCRPVIRPDVPKAVSQEILTYMYYNDGDEQHVLRRRPNILHHPDIWRGQFVVTNEPLGIDGDDDHDPVISPASTVTLPKVSLPVRICVHPIHEKLDMEGADIVRCFPSVPKSGRDAHMYAQTGV
ncbi:unnamed protein product [Allacma fusca]|uniref:Uncharacterized protein n=1 Tax=Allacma fusca TaxID=39272 RepID=A0A8J2PGR0_9HEXA|nr:unnamed protein product [Allacma fusca]